MTSIALMTQNVQEQHTVPIEQYLELKQQLTLARVHIEWQDERYKAVEQENCDLREELSESNDLVKELQQDKANLLEREERYEARIHKYEMEDRYQNALFRVEGKHLNGVDKQILLTLRNYNRTKSNDPHAMNRVCVGVLAQCVGGSPSNVSRRIDDLVAQGFLTKEFTGPTPKDPKSHIDIALPATLDDPTDIKRTTDQERKQGGARPCKKCGSELTDKYSVHVCRNCKEVTVNELPGNTTPYTQQDAFKVIVVDQEEQTTSNESQDNITEFHHDEISQQTNTETTELHHDGIIQKQVAPLAVINALVAMMSNYKVEYHPQRTCHCGCQLWRKVFGELECCQCEPAPLWPEQYNRAIKALYFKRKENA